MTDNSPSDPKSTRAAATPDNPQLPAWRQDLAGALHRNRADPGSRYLQLATVRRDGAPANRTLVFRGFDEHSGQLLMVSDERSSKPAELRREPRAAVAWYFAKTREQFRLSGRIQCLLPTDSSDAQSYCQSQWTKLSPAARSQYFWPEPGTPLALADAQGGAAAEVDAAMGTDAAAEAHASSPPPWFLVLTLEVKEVDHLELRPAPQRRRRYLLRRGHWQMAELNP